jgi:DNA repair exonuclease SbcCD ATPase subunit
MIKLKKLKWSNCFSYGEGNELELGSDTLTQLVGTNGTGKSSIPIILEEVLFNKNSKGIKKADIANRKVGKGYDITLEFSVNSDEYVLEVIRKGNIKCKLWENNKDISSHTATNTYKTLEEILGIDFKTFSQIVYQNTNASLQFLTATDTNRKKFLIDLLQLDNYVKYFEVFKNLSREWSSDISVVQGKVATIEKWLVDNKLENMTLLPKINLPIYSEEEEKTLRSLQLEYANISEKNKKINQNNYYKERLQSIDISDQSYEDKELQSYDSLQLKVGELQAIERKPIFAGTDEKICPTCKQEVNMELVENIQNEQREARQKAKNELIQIRDEIDSIKFQNERIIEHRNRKKEFEEVYRSIDQNLPSLVLSAEDLQNRIESLSEIINDRKEKLEEAIEENNKRERHNTRLSIIKEQTEKFETELEELFLKLDHLEDKLSCADILKKAFSTNGLLAYKIENLVKDLEELTNEYLAELSDGRFNLQFVVINDKLNVELDDDGKAVDILSLSAGELARVNTSTLLAIRKLMSSISKSRINVLFLDEVTNVLDEAGKEKLVEILLGEEELNTYIVSHGWTHPLLSKIEVIKENDISRLE